MNFIATSIVYYPFPDTSMTSPNIIQVIKSSRMRWVGLVSCMGKRRGAYRVLVGNLKEGDHFEGLGTDGRIILKWISKLWNVGMDWIDLVQERDRWQAFVNVVMNFHFP
jgi:hypothetical protein